MKPRLFCGVALLLAATFLAAGCIGPALPPPAELKLSGLDIAALKNKTIIIDPGHGGPERGAIAQNGLCEAEVNLGVALYVWGFLKDAGANPVLTRSSDTCLYRGEPFVLREELEARAAAGNAAKADLFVSIHHNSDGRERGEHNDLIVFYKMSDPGCSRDVAREVCASLKERMHAEPASVQPGNYLVLRKTAAPAILGEASYMNYKQNSEKLVYTRTLTAEAQGYFLGILNYFQKGVPAISFSAPAAATLSDARPRIEARLSAGAPGAAIDRDSIKACLDGRPTEGFVAGCADSVSYAPAAPLANGSHEFCLDCRNTAGNASQKTCRSFTVAVPAASISVKPVFSVIPADGQTAAPLDIIVHDSLDRPVMDGTPVELTASAGRLDNATLVTNKGRARAFLISDTTPQQVTVTVKAGAVRQHAALSFGTPKEALFMLEVKDSAGKPVAGAALSRAGREVGISDAGGRVYDSASAGGSAVYSIRSKGYETAKVTAELAAGKLAAASCSLQAVDNGIFFNRTIMLDAYGQSQEALPLLRELKSMIEHAGGTALLTWENAPAPSVQSRVMKAADARADLFLSFIFNKNPAVEYYYKSAQGEQLAENVCQRLNERKAFGKKTCDTAPGTDCILMQTSMTALLLRLPAAMKVPAHDAAAGMYSAIGAMFDKSASGM